MLASRKFSIVEKLNMKSDYVIEHARRAYTLSLYLDAKLPSTRDPGAPA